MNAPATPKFGDAIEVKGERPGWLPEGIEYQARGSLGDLWFTDKVPNADFHDLTAIRLEVPRYDFVYLGLERGMVPWFGGEEAPGDWDGGKILQRRGNLYTLPDCASRHWNPRRSSDDIIGYTRKATSTALPLAHPAAPQGEEGEGLTGEQAWDELVNVDDRTSPEEYPDMCLITRDELVEFMRRALAPAVIASGRGEGE